MPAKTNAHVRQAPAGGPFIRVAALIALALCGSAARAFAQFSSGSDGSDGAYAPTISANFDPTQFHGTGVANNVFNFTTITIPAGVTITPTAGVDNAPLYWLATGNVDIEGILKLDGAPGAPITSDVDVRLPALAGSGGYGGGVGGNSTTNQNATYGSGPGGGNWGSNTNTCGQGNPAGGGTFTGNQYLIPLVGGSGGGGVIAQGSFGPGGGAGGGAVLIASSTQITVNGTITANGGAGGVWSCDGGGGGSGGAIRLVSNTINGTGNVTAAFGSGSGNGSYGRVRLEAYTIGTSFNFNGTPVSESTPLSNFSSTIPTVPQPSVRVTSVNNIRITENPFSFPDITINTSQPVPVVITGHHVPVGTVPTLVILGETADQDLTCSGGLQGTLATSTCTINITFAFGGSRGLVTTTWTQ